MTIDFFPEWLQDLPLIQAIVCELPQPSLSDNTADTDRLVRALAQQGIAPVRFPPRRMGAFVRSMRALDFRFSVVIGFVDPCWEVLDIVPVSPAAPVLGFAVDLGTSSIEFRLIDIPGKKVLSENTILNPQIAYGEDILSRIFFARDEEGLKTLRDLLIDACGRAMGDIVGAQGLSLDNVYAVSCAGNTAMSHFFWGLDPANICREPYIPAVNTFPMSRAEELGFAGLPHALLYLFPNVGSYVGGDVVAGILATGLHRFSEPGMLIDVGTNAEVVLGNSEWLLACAGAAGPALEGGVGECGMPAVAGAIDRVRIDRRTLAPSWRVIGSGRPAGLCGSGLIDLIAEMFGAGIITVQGKFSPELVSSRIQDTPDGRAYLVVTGSQTSHGKNILISEMDIGVFLKSKAAMYTILSVISGKVGLTFKQIKRIYIAGNFGNRIDPEMAVRIGMIPDLPLERYRGIGNSSVLGASMLLLDRTMPAQAERVRSRITYIELNVNVELMNQFRGALFIPHTDRRLFPSVRVSHAGRQ